MQGPYSQVWFLETLQWQGSYDNMTLSAYDWQDVFIIINSLQGYRLHVDNV